VAQLRRCKATAEPPRSEGHAPVATTIKPVVAQRAFV
jgi:hypothetical protein